jgi:hypothetical protein
MDLVSELREQIRAYVQGRAALADLRLWLSDHVQEISDTGSRELDTLDGLVWVLLSELDYGHRTEDEVRRLLADVVAGPMFTKVPPEVEAGLDEGVQTVSHLKLEGHVPPPVSTVRIEFAAAPA